MIYYLIYYFIIIKYLSHEYNKNVLELVKPKVFYPYEYVSDFESLKKKFLARKGFIVF